MEQQVQQPQTAVGAPSQQAGALAKTPRSPLEFVPKNYDDAWRMAEMFSRANLIPKDLKDQPADTLVIIMTGAGYGLDPVQSFRDIYVVNGRPSMSALLKVALVRQSGLCRYWNVVESTDERCTIETQRVDEQKPTRLTYTIKQAEAAGLTKQRGNEPSQYTKRPALMLRRRCSSELADETYPEVIRGLPTREDLEEAIDAEAAVVQAPATHRGSFSAQVSKPPTASARTAKARVIPNEDPGQVPAEEELGPSVARAMEQQVAEAAPTPVAPEPKPVEPVAPVQAPAAPSVPVGKKTDEQIAQDLLAEVRACKSEKDLNVVRERTMAALPSGPSRNLVGTAINAKRAELRS